MRAPWLCLVIVGLTLSSTAARAQLGNPLDEGDRRDNTNPLDPPGPAGPPLTVTYQSAPVKDVTMGNVTAYTVMVPQGWFMTGQVEWAGGEWAQPTLTATINSPGGASVRWLASNKYGYIETDPAFLRQLDEIGARQPGQQEKTGTPPPSDVGQFVVESAARSRPELKNVRLIDQKRNEKAEAANARLFPEAASGSTLHDVAFAYEINGVAYREEMSLIYQLFPVADLPPTRMTTFIIMPTLSCAAPADQFDRLRPVFEEVGKSMQMTEQWFACRMRATEELAARRHAGNMRDIADAGKLILQQGEKYGKDRDDDHRRWMARNQQN